ncbi:MAG: LysR family transcriptional regulator [Clostridia bacterium]|nr:LysR family transcriptional regulator [Clostridia bacterium]
MKAVTRIVIVDDNGEKFFGEGPARLMRGIEKTGSLRGAAMSMGMAYTKALKLIGNAEKALGFPLTERATGGIKGGGSRITPEGKEWLLKYENYRDVCMAANAELYLEFFPEQR